MPDTAFPTGNVVAFPYSNPEAKARAEVADLNNKIGIERRDKGEHLDTTNVRVALPLFPN